MVRACKLRATCRRAPDCSETCEELYIEGYDWWRTVRLRIWETSLMEVNRRTLRGGTIDLMVVCNYTACLLLLGRQRMRVL